MLRRPRTVGEKALVAGSIGGLALFLAVPIVVLVERSLAAEPAASLVVSAIATWLLPARVELRTISRYN